MTRNDAARRTINASYRPGDIWADKTRWLPVVEQVQARLTTQGVDRPAGLPADGALCVSYYMLACSGLVKWVVRYQLGRQWIVIGGFITEFLPDDKRVLKPKPVKTHGKTVVVNYKVAGELARPVRVLVDASGLPVPVPEHLWREYGLDG